MELFDYSALLGKIKEVCGTQELFAEKMGMSTRTLCLKIHGKRDFKSVEIYKAAKILGISPELVSLYFFVEKVRNNE